MSIGDAGLFETCGTPPTALVVELRRLPKFCAISAATSNREGQHTL